MIVGMNPLQVRKLRPGFLSPLKSLSVSPFSNQWSREERGQLQGPPSLGGLPSLSSLKRIKEEPLPQRREEGAWTFPQGLRRKRRLMVREMRGRYFKSPPMRVCLARAHLRSMSSGFQLCGEDIGWNWRREGEDEAQ